MIEKGRILRFDLTKKRAVMDEEIYPRGRVFILSEEVGKRRLEQLKRDYYRGKYVFDCGDDDWS